MQFPGKHLRVAFLSLHHTKIGNNVYCFTCIMVENKALYEFFLHTDIKIKMVWLLLMQIKTKLELAEILGDDSPMLGLPCARNSLDCFKARGSSVWKCGKNSPKNQFFEKVQYRYVSAWVQNQVSQVPQTLTHSGKMSETTPHSVGGEQPFCLAVPTFSLSD